MKQYNVFAKNIREEEPLIQMNNQPISEKDLDKAIMFYLARGEWLDRGYVLIEKEI